MSTYFSKLIQFGIGFQLPKTNTRLQTHLRNIVCNAKRLQSTQKHSVS